MPQADDLDKVTGFDWDEGNARKNDKHGVFAWIVSCSYPEGNFGGNQLLDGSISLSPLYPNSTIDLHVRIATSLHQSFPWLHPIQA